MTQSTETIIETSGQSVAPPIPSNVPFNLIVATSAAQVQKIAKHFDLNDVRFVDNLKLPLGGAKRGDALNELLGKVEHTVTLAVTTDAPWVQTLLSNSAMASSVWRSIESQLLGHRTGSQRNLLIVATDFNGGCREAENAGQLLVVHSGAPLPNNWKPERARIETKKPEGKKVQTKAPIEKKVQGDKPTKIKNATRSGVVHNPEGFKVHGVKTGRDLKPQLDRSKKTKGPRPTGSNESLYDDLYLLSKGHYGVPTGPHYIVKAQQLIAHHTGFGGNITLHMVVVNLFRTLIAKSSRGFWGGFHVLQSVIEAGGQGTEELIETLNGYIGTIPARDGQGNEIPQPKANQQLYVKLNLVAEVVDVPAGKRELSAQAA
jgi:hypothetical protein